MFSMTFLGLTVVGKVTNENDAYCNLYPSYRVLLDPGVGGYMFVHILFKLDNVRGKKETDYNM